MTGLGGRHTDSQGQSSSLETEAGRKFDTALFAALDALEESQVSYALIGGIAATSLGRPRGTQDIDVFVRPEDAEAILGLLENKGFRTEQTHPTWLYKAFKEGVLIDIIFRSEGGFYYDDEMRERTLLVPYHGRQVRVISPEDFVLIKCAVHSEECPHHWHDALAVLSHAKVDWEYLLHRSRKAQRRLAALLVYAQSDDIWVPNWVIQRLHDVIFGAPAPQQHRRPAQGEVIRSSTASQHHAPGQASPEPYMAARVREALIQDEHTGAMGTDVFVQGKQILVRGQIQTQAQHESVLSIVREMAPGYEINDQLQVADYDAPHDVKEIV
ncbi:MAG: nucleotidyltransferase [Bdellovibrionales bacterium]